MNKEIIEKIAEIQRGIRDIKDKSISEQDLVLDYITIFTHNKKEFSELVRCASKMGKKIDEHNGPVFRLNNFLKFDNGILKIFRIRKPDIERPQKGCGDFITSDYAKFKRKYSNKKNFVLFKGKGFEFMGIHDFSKDFLVYFPNIPLTKELNIK